MQRSNILVSALDLWKGGPLGPPPRFNAGCGLDPSTLSFL
jgi:hypothetical protein